MILSKEDRDYLLNDGNPVSGYYVYGWVNEDWGGVYFYIGKGRGDRYNDVKKRGMAFKAICENWNCFPVILEDGLTEEEAERREAEIKEHMIFELGFPIMDGEGHSSTLKHLATQRAKRKLRASNPDWHEGRKPLPVPAEFEEYRKRVECGEVTVKALCLDLKISRSTWYKWVREETADAC